MHWRAQISPSQTRPHTEASLNLSWRVNRKLHFSRSRYESISENRDAPRSLGIKQPRCALAQAGNVTSGMRTRPWAVTAGRDTGALQTAVGLVWVNAGLETYFTGAYFPLCMTHAKWLKSHKVNAYLGNQTRDLGFYANVHYIAPCSNTGNATHTCVMNYTLSKVKTPFTEIDF